MRTDSIYEKLQRHDAKNGTTYFLDLMIFLAESGGDKYGQAASLVSDTWKFKTSKTALYAGHAEAESSWQLGLARNVAIATETLTTFDKAQAKLIAQSSFALLSDPDFRKKNPELILGYAKLEVEKIKASTARDKFEFNAATAALKHLDALRSIRNDRSLDADARLLRARQQLFGELPKA